MFRFASAFIVILPLLWPARGSAVEATPRIGDREIIERLARLEEGQQALREGLNALRKEHELLRVEVRTEVQQLRQDMAAQNQQLRQDMAAQNQQLRQDVRAEIQQLRVDINDRFATLTQIVIAQLGAFAAIFLFTIGFALWDRKTMTRPLEDKLKTVEDEMAQNRPRFHALLEALRATSARDPQVAEVLRKFDLL